MRFLAVIVAAVFSCLSLPVSASVVVSEESNTKYVRRRLNNDDDENNGQYGFLVLLIANQEDGPWCLSATETRKNGNLRLHLCDFTMKPEHQLWSLLDDDDGQQSMLRSKVDNNNRCMQTGFGFANDLFDGVHMRLGTCDDDKYTKIELDRTTNYLKILAEDNITSTGFCITNVGVTANHNDIIHAKPCPSTTARVSSDYQWEFQFKNFNQEQIDA